MSQPIITVTGYLVEPPQYVVTSRGLPLFTMKLGCTPRRFDAETGRWRDLETMHFTVQCWRVLADNLNACELQRGHPLVVTGKLRIRDYEDERGRQRFSAEIEAAAVGHDLNRGVAKFERPQRVSVAMAVDRQEAESLADQFAVTPGQTTPGEEETPAAVTGDADATEEPWQKAA